MREFIRLEYIDNLKAAVIEDEDTWLSTLTSGMDKDQRRMEIKTLKLQYKRLKREWDLMTKEDQLAREVRRKEI